MSGINPRPPPELEYRMGSARILPLPAVAASVLTGVLFGP
jgi:hypothetical protein